MSCICRKPCPLRLLQVMAFRDAEGKWDSNKEKNYVVPVPHLPPLPADVICDDIVAPGIHRKVTRRPNYVDVELRITPPRHGGESSPLTPPRLLPRPWGPRRHVVAVRLRLTQVPLPDAVIHWGVNGWFRPDESVWPPRTRDFGSDRAVETDFVEDGGTFRVSFDAKDVPSRLVRPTWRA